MNNKHGMTNSPPFRSWMAMVQRCSNPSDPHKQKYYKDVPVNSKWLTDFLDFYSHIGEQPNDGKKYSIERIKNELGYTVGNVRWATTEEQARNKRLQARSRTKVNGVSLRICKRRGKEGLSYVAVAYSLDGGRIRKAFSVGKYGLLPAFTMACQARQSMIDNLNQQGAGYSAQHGK